LTIAERARPSSEKPSVRRERDSGTKRSGGGGRGVERGAVVGRESRRRRRAKRPWSRERGRRQEGASLSSKRARPSSGGSVAVVEERAAVVGERRGRRVERQAVVGRERRRRRRESAIWERVVGSGKRGQSEKREERECPRVGLNWNDVGEKRRRDSKGPQFHLAPREWSGTTLTWRSRTTQYFFGICEPFWYLI